MRAKVIPDVTRETLQNDILESDREAIHRLHR